MSVTKIVLTGGPCSGKTSAQKWITDEMEKRGYKVIFIPEIVTGFSEAGIGPKATQSFVDYEKKVLKMQLYSEEIMGQLAETLPDEKILIVCDRGAADIEAYIGRETFNEALKAAGTNKTKLFDRYDAVIHLVTAAYGAEKFYTLSNNAARYETVEEARNVDDKLKYAWVGHPYFRVVDNSTDFEGKKERLLKELLYVLGEPEPLEIERKFLIEYPDIKWLESLPNCQKVEIVQAYITNEDGNEERIRQRGFDGNFACFHIIKQLGGLVRRVEKERRISKDEYLQMLLNADFTNRLIRKDRYCLLYESRYLEIDVYPFWKDKAMVEVELCDGNEEIKLPPQINVISEVTGLDEYKGINMAKARFNL